MFAFDSVILVHFFGRVNGCQEHSPQMQQGPNPPHQATGGRWVWCHVKLWPSTICTTQSCLVTVLVNLGAYFLVIGIIRGHGRQLTGGWLANRGRANNTCLQMACVGIPAPVLSFQDETNDAILITVRSKSKKSKPNHLWKVSYESINN